jgi:hypothetical protein
LERAVDRAERRRWIGKPLIERDYSLWTPALLMGSTGDRDALYFQPWLFGHKYLPEERQEIRFYRSPCGKSRPAPYSSGSVVKNSG